MAKTKLELRDEIIIGLLQEVQDLKTQIEQTVWDSCECWKKPVYRSGICTETSCVRTK